MSNDTILKLEVLASREFSIDKLKKLLSRDKRNFERDIQRLIILNKRAFEYLGVEASGKYNDSFEYSLWLHASEYSGVVPLRSARTGVTSGYLKIEGRYGEQIDEILPILEDEDLTPEFDNRMVIDSDMAAAPPKYIECVKYLDTYVQAERYHWQKFSNRTIIQARPRNTDWVSYSLKSFNPSDVFNYPNRINELTTEHPEWAALKYVLSLAISELESIKTPASIKSHFASTINRLERTYDLDDLHAIDYIAVHASDPTIIKSLKTLANLILSETSSTHCAWRIDYSRFFERYVQHVFAQLARKRGARVVNNPHFYVTGQKPAWVLKYLEPDLVMTKDGDQLVVDAKYKSHMYNRRSNSTELRDVFRSDFHQVLAYSSFSLAQPKKAVIVYPAKNFKYYSITIHSSVNGQANKVFIVGIPISKVSIDNTVESLNKII